MRFSFCFVFLLFVVTSIRAQITTVPDGYSIDTIITQSVDDSTSFDTLIVYRKTNIVKKQIIIENPPSIDSLQTVVEPIVEQSEIRNLRYLIQIAYMPTESSSFVAYVGNKEYSKQLQGVVAGNFGVAHQFKRLSIGATLGCGYGLQRTSVTSTDTITNTYSYSVIDTVESYFVVEDNGVRIEYITQLRDTAVVNSFVVKRTHNQKQASLFAQCKFTSQYLLYARNQFRFSAMVAGGVLMPIYTIGNSFAHNGTVVNARNEIKSVAWLAETGIVAEYTFNKLALQFNATLSNNNGTRYTDIFPDTAQRFNIQWGVGCLF